ncbi:hypothetical protein Tco_0929534 [Tanacetum coccineum]
MYYPRFTKVIIHHFLFQEKSLSWRNKIGMHTSKDDYLINSLRFVSAKESTQIYGAILPECLTSPAMKESKEDKTYLGYATGVVPPKVARKFKKASASKKDSDLVPVDEEPSKRKEKEKVDVAHGKGIELLSDVGLTEESQIKEVKKKSLRDFHKTHPSGSSMIAEDPPSVEKITPTVTSEGTGDGVPDVTKDDSTESESESWGEEKASDLEQKEESDDDDQEDEEFGIDDTTDQFDDDVDARLEEPTQTGKEVVQGEGVDVEMIGALNKGNEILETTQEQVVDDAHVTISHLQRRLKIVSPFDVPVQREVPNTQTTTLLPIHVSVITTIPQSLQTFTPLPLVSTPTPPPTIETTNPLSTLPDFASVFRFNDRITTLEKEVAEIKRPRHTQVTYLVDENLDTVKEDPSRQDGENSKDKDKDEDPSWIRRGLKKIRLAKMPEPTTGPKNKDSSSGSPKAPSSTKIFECIVQSKEPVFEVANSDMPQDQEGNLGDNDDEPRKETASRRDWFKKPTPPQEPTDPDWNIGKTTQEGPTQNWLMTLEASTSTDKSLLKGTRSNYAELQFDFGECYKALLKKLDWENPKGGDNPFDLSKPLPLIIRGNGQKVPFEFFINNDLKYLQGGVSTMTFTTSTTKSNTAKYDLPCIEDMVPNIWSPVKVAYDRYALWGISH